jgi:hypothetical protein
VTQNRILKLNHTSTHKFPDLFPVRRQQRPDLMTFNWVSNAAETASNFHDGHFVFCPANSQLYRFVIKPQPGTAANRADPALGRWLATG